MKTFLGVHYPPVGMRNGIGSFFSAGAAGVVTFECGFPTQSNQFYATRFKANGEDNPPNFYTDPLQAARDHFYGQQTKWTQNPGAKARLSNNELDIETPWHASQQLIFNMEFMRLCETVGEFAGICNYAGGNPSDNQLLDGSPCSLEDRWRPLLPAIKYAGEHGHYVVLHIHQQDKGNMESESGQQISLRHRRSIAYWLNNAAHPECVITKPPRIIFNEVSNGVGGVEPNEDQYFTSVTWLDQYMRTDPYNSLYTVLGLYQAGAAEPITESMYNRLAAYIQAQPDIVINPLPVDDPQSPPLNIIVTENLIPQDTTQEELAYVQAQTFKQDVLWSADTAKFLVQNALPGSKVIVWEPSRWTQGDIIVYLGVPTEIKHFPGTPQPEPIRLSNPVPSIPFRVTSEFDTPRNYANGKHEGLDLDGYNDATGQTVPVVACADGVVTTVNNTVVANSYGKYVIVDHQNWYKTWYCHLSLITVVVGQSVTMGQQIGITGASGTSAIHLHLNLQHIGHGLSGYYIPDVVDPLPYIDYDETPTPTPVVDTYFGLGYGNQYEIPQSHADLYGTAFSSQHNPAFLFLTLPDYGAMTRTIQKIKSKTHSAFLMARMFFSVGNTPFSPQNFVDYSHNGTSAAYASGIRDFQPGNEWNIEGMNINWTNGVQFGNWLKEVITILKGRYPDARFWYPALSPNASAPQFFIESLITGVGAMLHGYCYHDYFWTESGGQYNMVDETGGLQHKKLQRLLPASEQGKPTSITEFSCNTPSVQNSDKGRMYKRYRDLLKQNGVHSAFSFVLNWSPDNNKENWANSNGGSTGIYEGFLSA